MMNTELSTIPITVIGGYLGSGKTTLVNHLLHQANGARLAILVNDFGDLAIDADLIQSQQGDVISLSGGCVCCSYGDDLTLSLQKLKAQSPQPDHIIVEASGVALPGAIGRSVSLQRAYRLEGIVVVADASTVMANANEKYIGDTIERQLHDADLVILNKVDLMPSKKNALLKQWIGKKSVGAPVIDAIQCVVDSAVLFDIEPCRAKKAVASDAADLANVPTLPKAGHHDLSVYATLSISAEIAPEQTMDVDALAAKLANKQLALIRAKGFVRDKDNVVRTIQVVGRRWSVSLAPEGVQVGLVCIAKKGELPETAIRSLFCQATTESI